MTRARFQRRSVLTLVGAAVTALAGCTDVGNGDGDGNGGGDGGGSEATKVELGGKTEGWVGRTPASIDGQQNPTLQLEAGTTYELTWENLDGVEHELIIESAGGEELQATESASETSATRTVTFTASEEMASYYCEYHPESMRGDVKTGSDGGG